MGKLRFGDGTDNVRMDEDITDTDTHYSKVTDLRSYDTVGVQLVVDYQTESVPFTAGDNVVALTKVWTIDGFDFTGLDGATLRVEGSAEGNDGDYTITSGGDGTFTSTEAVAADETFASDVVFTLVHDDDPLQGAWHVEISNNYVGPGGGAYGEVESDGNETWTNIDGVIWAAFAAVTDAGSQARNNTFPLGYRAIRFYFVPTDGVGHAKVLLFAKDI